MLVGQVLFYHLRFNECYPEGKLSHGFQRLKGLFFSHKPKDYGMKNKHLKASLSSITALLMSFLASPIFAERYIPIPMELCLMPYIGVDGLGRHTNFASGFGGNLFKKDYPEVSAYLGLKLNDYFGIEAGYKVSTLETQTSSLGAGETASGIPVAFPPAVHRGTTSYKGWHGEFVGYLPIMLPDCVYLLGTIGFNRVEFFARDKLVQDNAGLAPPQAFAEGEFTRTFKKTQTVLTLGTGLQIQIDEKSSIRFKVGWENTSSIKSLSPQESGLGGSIKPCDSFIYGIGFVINFL